MRLALVFILALAGMARAEVVDVRSGEHGDFTRLVFDLPSASTEWSVSPVAEGHLLALALEDPQFRASGVFERIGRNRLRDLRLRDGQGDVMLVLGCDCELSAFRFGARSLVIDIADRPPAAAVTEAPQVQPPEPSSTVADMPASVLQDDDAARLKDRLLGLSEHLPDDTQVTERRNQLVEAIARAASQGLVEPKKPLTEPESAAKKVTETPPVQLELVRPGPGENLTATTALDQVFGDVEEALPQGGCIADGKLDIENWGGPDGAGKAFAKYRRAMINDLGEVDPEEAMHLARSYLYFSFGAEALALLGTLPDSEQRSLYRILAHLMDGTSEATVQDALRSQSGCDGRIALWVALSGVPQHPEQVASVLRGYEALPPHLRRHFGQALADHLTSEGEVEAAEIVLTSLSRLPQEDDTGLHLATARVEIAQGETGIAEARLSEMVAEGSRMTPEAIVALVDLHKAEQLVPSPEIVGVLETLTVELRRDEIGPDLRRSLATAHALTRYYAAGFDVVRRVQSLDGPDAARALASELVFLLVETGDDFAVIETSIRYGLGSEMEIDLKAGRVLAHRLLGAGFAAQAAHVIEGLSLGLSQEDRLLRAELALAQGRPKRAEAEVLGMQGYAANSLRARARQQAGDHARAAQAYFQLGETEEGFRQAWLAADWHGLGDSEVPALQDISQIMLPKAAAPEAAGPLAANRTLLEESEKVRDVLSAVLDAHSVSEN